MAGTIRGKVDCWANAGNQYDNIQTCFKNIYDFLKLQLEPAGVVTEVARWGGSGSAPTSTGYWDEPSPFRSGAFSVFRWNPNGGRTWPWYMLVQWARGDQTSFGNTSSSPATLNNSSTLGSTSGMLGIAAAIGVGGDENPWKGTGSIGSSVKATPVWGIPTGGTDVYVLPRSNNSGGTHNTNKENCTSIYSIFTDTRPLRHHLVADADSFLFMADAGDTGFYSAMYSGTFTPISGLSHPYPYLQFEYPMYISSGQTFGPTGGGSPGGGIVMPTTVSGARVRQAVFSRLDEFLHLQYLMSPNQIAGNFDLHPLMFGSNETASHAGLVGYVDLMREIAGLPSYLTNASKTLATFGHVTYNTGFQSDRYQKFAIPWDGVHFPRTNPLRTGYTF
jgi:hypothetical protein